MAQKPTKISDVKHPEGVTPAATSRPILVTSRPMMTSDPMVVPTTDGEPPKPVEPVARTAKTIEPVSATLDVPDEQAPQPTSPEAEMPAKANDEKPEATEPDPAPTPAVEAKPETNPLPEPGEDEPKRDVEAELSADEAAALEAKVAREQELEQLIASGKFKVPIDAAQRKRSHLYVTLLCVFALVVALVLLDVALDMNLLHLPINVPHTNLF